MHFTMKLPLDDGCALEATIVALALKSKNKFTRLRRLTAFRQLGHNGFLLQKTMEKNVLKCQYLANECRKKLMLMRIELHQSSCYGYFVYVFE